MIIVNKWLQSYWLVLTKSHEQVHSAPEDDPYLSKYERRLVDQERRAEFLRNSMRVQLESDSSKKLVKVPPKFRFKTVLSSGPVWASLVCKFATGLGYYTITTKIPVRIAFEWFLCNRVYNSVFTNTLFEPPSGLPK